MKPYLLVATYTNVVTVFATQFAFAQTAASAPDTIATTSATPMTSKQLRMTNRMLSRAVRRSLNNVRDLDSSGVTILARNGKVTLEGGVSQNSQVQIAEDAASATPGVMSVDNRLTLKLPGN